MEKIIMFINRKIAYFFCGVLIFMIKSLAFAIVIGPNTIINSDRTYSFANLDMTNGNFIVKNNATLNIIDCDVNAKLSPTNPILFKVERGNLRLDDNNVSVTTQNIFPHPYTQALQYVVELDDAKATLANNDFKIDKSFAAGLLITMSDSVAHDIRLINNRFKNFHGVLYLINTDKTLIDNNIFDKNSYGNIVVTGIDSKIINNKIYFSGSDHLGNSIDILDAENVLIKNNQLILDTHTIWISRDKIAHSNR